MVDWKNGSFSYFYSIEDAENAIRMKLEDPDVPIWPGAATI